MLRGCGLSSAASLGPSSLAALASTLLPNFGSLRVAGVLNPSAEILGQHSLSTVPSAAPSTSENSKLAGDSTQSTDAEQDGSLDLPLDFSLRPSVLSPLFPSWERVRRISQRREHLTALLNLQMLLVSSIQAGNERAVEREVRKRVQAIQQTATELRQLLGEAVPVAKCPSPEYAAAYCAALEASAAAVDPSAHEFARVQRGEVSPWAYYARYFQQPYKDAPRLQPLEVIFSKPDPVELVQRIRASARQAAASGTGAAAKGAAGIAGLPRGAIGPHIDVAGVTHTEGKRKASCAKLDLLPGSGQFTVNGLPIAEYFREVDVRRHALEPLTVTGSKAKYDISVRVKGGGCSGQAQAVRTALARALCVQQPDLAASLAEMTRWDGRVVERKKPGRAKARRGFTWVKR